jgi:hypothetical protein
MAPWAQPASIVRMKRSALAVGLGPVGPGAAMLETHRAARERVNGRAVGGAIVGEDALDGDAMGGVERQRAA